MTNTVPRASINQQIQIGVESVAGTPVACGKILDAFIWTFGAKPTTKQFRGTGRQHPSASALLTEMAAGKLSGPFDFAQNVYPVSSLFGAATIAAVANSVAVNTWKWTPALTGSYAAIAKTFTLQNGDSTDAEQYAYSTFTGWGYSFTRKAEATTSADWMSQTFTDSVFLTASPAVVAQNPGTGAQFNLYLDTTSANIGNTQLTDPLKVDFMASGYYDAYWPLNRANASFTSIVDKEKKNELKMTLQANTAGIAIRGNYLENGAKAYVRVNGQGQLIENDQTVGVGAASAGTFTLTYKGQTTSAIAYNALASAVQSALRALSTIGSTGCSVTGTAPTWTVQMTGALANDTTAMTGSGSGLTGGALAITASPFYATFTHDMVVFVTSMAEFSDVDGVYAVEYTFEVAEDAAWSTGQSQIITFQNTLSAL